MAVKILVMGLPGAGKTSLSEKIVEAITAAGKTVEWLNADEIREKYNDWDFSHRGRIRQSERIATLAHLSIAEYVIADFVAPIKEMRDNYAADWTIWVDTIEKGRYEDTNKIFDFPTQYDFHVTEQNREKWGPAIAKDILENRRKPTFDFRKETVQMLGRWQPWHAGHRALFERALAKTGQVVIQIRDCEGWNNSNPFNLKEVEHRIRKDLDPEYQGRYHVMVVPNIVNITYGRDVGYKIEQEVFDDAVHNISATKIRKEMGIE